MSITHSSRFVATVGGAVVALGLMFGAIAAPVHAAALTPSQVSAIVSLLQSFGADANTIANVQASLNGQATTGGTTTTTGGSCTTTFTSDMTVGSTGASVMALQKFLNTDSSTMVSSSGAGSPGMETSTFGPATKAAVMKFQTKYGISPVSGFVGPLTRAKLNSLCGSTTTNPGNGGTTPPTSGTGTAMISAAAQPANGIAPFGAARIPFTKFTVTASGGDVTLNNVTVERDGIASDQAFTGVMLLDQNGNQVGISKTLNSNHQAVIGSAVVIPNGTSMTFTVAANRQNANGTTGFAGQIATFSVVAVNTSAAVTSGALPISGASQTINEASNLIGSITAQRGTNDPGSANDENVGQTSYVFSSVRLTAGSSEDTYLKSIRFHQIGSVSQSYLTNVAIVVDGTSYPATVSSDNYYTSNFPGQGILIQKGFSKDVAIQGDINNGSGTTVQFDIQKSSDINVVGAQYGYGILPSFLIGGTSAAGTVNSTDDSYYTGYTVNVKAGTVTVSTTNAVTASNVALNTQDQTLGGFQVQVQGEPITVGKMVYNLGTTTVPALWIDSSWVSNVKLVDQAGHVLAGPVDASAGVLTFTDSVTLPIGTTQLFVKGKLGTNFKTNDTLKVVSGAWSTVVGQNTGKTLSVSASGLTSATMTIKAQALTVSVSATPIGQTVISGINQYTFSNLVLDATNSGEDVRVTTLPVLYTYTGGTTLANNVTNCQLYNGSTSVSDQHVVNPSNVGTTYASPATISFSLNSGGIVIPKGTSVTLSVKCDLRSGASNTIQFGLGSLSGWTGASGVTSGSTVTAVSNTSTGPAMVASSSGGAMTVALDSSTPSYGVVAAGSTGVDLGHIRFAGTNEAIDLRQVALQISGGNNYDLVNNQVTLWDATTNTQVGTAVFASGPTATSSAIATGAFRIPQNGSRVLIVKGDIAAINVSGPITVSGDTLKVDYDGSNVTGTNGTYGVGVSSGQNSAPTSIDTAVKGVEIVKSFPTFTYSTSGAVAVSGNQPLLTLTVGADSKGDVVLNKLTFTVNVSNATLSSPTFSGPNGSVASTSLATSSNILTVYFDNSTNTSDAVVAAGTTKTYTLRGTVALNGGNSTGSVSTSLKADISAVAFGATSTLSASNIIWSPESTSTSVVGSSFLNDWTNGYGLGGCFATSGLGQDCFANVVSK